MCFVWGWLYPWAWAGRTCDFGRANLCSPFPWPQPLFRFEHMIKSGSIKVKWNSLVTLMLELLGGRGFSFHWIRVVMLWASSLGTILWSQILEPIQRRTGNRGPETLWLNQASPVGKIQHGPFCEPIKYPFSLLFLKPVGNGFSVIYNSTPFNISVISLCSVTPFISLYFALAPLEEEQIKTGEGKNRSK